MNMGSDFLESISLEKHVKPDNMEMIYYLFWEKGIDETQFNKLSIPYIFKILKTHNWVKKEEEKAHKKASKR